MRKLFFLVLFAMSLIGCSKSTDSVVEVTDSSQLYSKLGKEHRVQFTADFYSRYARLSDIRSEDLVYEIQRVHPFLVGPLVYRTLGGVQKGEKTEPLLDQARIVDGHVIVPYRYTATWMIAASEAQRGSLTLPVPFSVEKLRTANWRSCTDTADPEHSTWSFFWYFWEPKRPGCEHQLGQQYQNVEVEILEETPQTQLTFPEYGRMIHLENGEKTLAFTFAFGYVEDPIDPDPFRDADPGASQFQIFYRSTKAQLLALGYQERSIQASEYDSYGSSSRVIGSEFKKVKAGVTWRFSIVAAAGVDQMDLFARSFTQRHEGFFAWFGHSRVGSGFDAETLKRKLQRNPEKFSISPEYQLVYWAGCNSYSYYTKPFFEMKAALSPETDPNGTRNLDLISNTLPSLFAFNAGNANVMLQALLRPDTPTSYQNLIDQIESLARNWGQKVIVNVLGDEDNG